MGAFLLRVPGAFFAAGARRAFILLRVRGTFFILLLRVFFAVGAPGGKQRVSE